MAGVTKQIIGSFEDIGKDIAREAVKVPKDIVGKALESLGTRSQKNPQQAHVPPKRSEDAAQEKVSKATARAALQNIAGPQKPKEPTVQERFAKEEQEKKEKRAKEMPKMAPLAHVPSKPKRGNLYGIKQKASSEASKNVRQD